LRATAEFGEREHVGRRFAAVLRLGESPSFEGGGNNGPADNAPMGQLRRLAQGYRAHRSSELAAVLSTLFVLGLSLMLIAGEAAAQRNGASSKLSITTVTPGAGATVSGTITWQVDVSGGTPARVTFAVDGSTKWSQATSPYLYGGVTAGLDTTALSNGSHTLTATAYPTGKGRSVRATVSVSVSNGVATAPTWSVPPSVSGTAVTGQTLTSSTGTWDGTSPMTYSYQWQRCDSSGSSCATISGATGSSYVVSSADQGSTLRSQVTASNSAGSATELSMPTPVVTASSTWTNVVNDQFSALTALPSYWCTYNSHDKVYGGNYDPAHVYVSGGVLHLLQAYESNGAYGAGWYAGAIALVRNASGGCGGGTASSPYPLSAVDSRLTVRMRVLETGNGTAAGHRNILRWPDDGSLAWPTGGEEDMWEGEVSLTDNTRLFLHYGAAGSTTQVVWKYPTIDLSQWHTFRFQRLNDVISVYVDDLTTPVYTYDGNSTTLPETIKHWIFQQQCPHTGCPAPSTDTEDWQVASIAIDNAS